MSSLYISYGEVLEVSTSKKIDHDLRVCHELDSGLVKLCKFKVIV